MLPLSVTLAKKYNAEKHQVEGWYISEKLDGIRAVWFGKEGVFKTRNGNRIATPASFTEPLPNDVILDGELWSRRGLFSKSSSVVRKKEPIEQEWKDITYQVFDLIDDTKVFEERYQILQRLPNINVVRQEKGNVNEKLKEVELLGGEGLMLKNPWTTYEHKRTANLLKVKSFQEEEATVIGHFKGKRKYEQVTGALHIELSDGKRCKVGSGMSDAERANPPPIGSTVTIQFFEKTKKGLPRFPTYKGMRTDK
jgi:DNA ligase-1